MNRAEAYDHERKALKRPVPENKSLPGPGENKNDSKEEDDMGMKWVGRGERRRQVDDGEATTDFASPAARELATENGLTPADFAAHESSSDRGYTKDDVQYIIEQKAGQ